MDLIIRFKLFVLRLFLKNTIYRENFALVFFFALFALWPEGEFKTELYLKDYIRKLGSGWIQDWANLFQNSIGRKQDWANSKLYKVF